MLKKVRDSPNKEPGSSRNKKFQYPKRQDEGKQYMTKFILNNYYKIYKQKKMTSIHVTSIVNFSYLEN